MIVEALVQNATAEHVTLAAPRLGAFTARVSKGDAVAPGQVVGTLHVLGAQFSIIAPAGVVGHVEQIAASGTRAGVGYGAPLLVLSVQVSTGAASSGAPVSDIAGEAFDAPMDGQFYRRPTPDDPPFASPGDVVQPGQTIGLIEVMKFFYPIVWEGEGPRVLLTWVADDGPVQAGETLLRWSTE
jgi:acetyl-CoA carboxylase biotin carboxyl carrier protein